MSVCRFLGAAVPHRTALALAVPLDASAIHMMLVPSLLGVLGEPAWRRPAWLDRRRPLRSFDD